MLEDFEFHYTDEQREKLAELRCLIENDESLQIGTEDVLLSKFLFFTQWQVEKALKSIHDYYEFKIRHPDWLSQGPISKIREIFFYTQSKFLMPKPDREGRAILVFKSIDAYDKFPNYLQDIIQLDDMIFETVFLMPQVQKHGITIIYDLTCVTRNLIAKTFLPSLARILNEKNEVLPITSRRIHYVQKGIIMNTAISIFKTCLSKKIREQIFNHDFKNLNSLRDAIGYENLPSELGGPPENVLDCNLLFNLMVKNENYLLKLQEYHKTVPSK